MLNRRWWGVQVQVQRLDKRTRPPFVLYLLSLKEKVIYQHLFSEFEVKHD